MQTTITFEARKALGAGGHLRTARAQPAHRRAQPQRLLLIAAATLFALVLGAVAPAVSRAAAQTYCVHQAGFSCPAGAVDEGKNLQPALDDAANNPSTPSAPNVITIGPGTYQPPPGTGFSATTANPLQINGAGIGQTTLSDLRGRSFPPTQALALAGPAASSTSISNVTVSSSDDESLVGSNVTIEHVEVDPIGAGNGILVGGATVKDSTIQIPAGSMGVGIASLGPATSEIDDVTVDGGGEGIVGSPTNIRRARLIGSSIPLLVQGGAVYIDDSLLVGQSGIRAQNDGAGHEGSITALNDTIVAEGSSPHAGVTSESTQSPAQADVQISDSIVQGFPTSFETSAVPGGSASLEAFNDNFDGTTQGTSISVAGRISGGPGFVNPGAGDYRLAWNSALIDAGDTGFVSSIASATDLDGNPREVRSSTASSSPLDVGAYEYQHRLPGAVASAAPSSAPPGSAFTFDGSRSSDPDDGDTLTYAWSFDDGGTATGATVTHVFNTRGAHRATLTVTDPTGLTSKQSSAVTVTSPPAPATKTPSGVSSNPALPHLTVRKILVKGNKLTLTLFCTRSAACSGIHVLETTTNPKTHKRPAQVALARLSLKAGQSKTITLTPSGTGAGLLKRFGKLSVAITVTMTTAGKTASVKKAQPLCTRRRSRATRTLRLRPCCQRIGCSHSASPRSW
jgi:PKD repeat protein